MIKKTNHAHASGTYLARIFEPLQGCPTLDHFVIVDASIPIQRVDEGRIEKMALAVPALMIPGFLVAFLMYVIKMSGIYE